MGEAKKEAVERKDGGCYGLGSAPAAAKASGSVRTPRSRASGALVGGAARRPGRTVVSPGSELKEVSGKKPSPATRERTLRRLNRLRWW